MTYTLTDTGWPRPLDEAGRPIPWVAPDHNLGEVNHGRRLASVGGAVCQVCGLGFSTTDDAFAFTSMTFDGVDTDAGELPLKPGQYLSALLPAGSMVIPLDGAVMHLRCTRLTAATCPHVRDNPSLICVRVPANDADPVEIDGTLRPSYSAGDVEMVEWPTRRTLRHAQVQKVQDREARR